MSNSQSGIDENAEFKIKPKELATVFAECFMKKEPLLVVGPPGVGKTEITEQVTARLGYDLITMYPAISEPVDFRGMPIYDRAAGEAKFEPFGSLVDLISAPKPTVVLVDDFGQANISVQAAMMHLFRARQIGDHKISDNVTFVICTNDKTHHAGVTGVIEPVKSRMISILHLQPDVDDWVEWAFRNKIRPEVIGFIRLRNEMLSSFEATMDFENTPSPRGNEAVSRIINMNLSNKELELKMIKGACGRGYAVEFLGFKRIFDEIDDPRKILTDPHGVYVPQDNPSVVWAYCTALTYLAAPKHMDAIVAFARRLPIEFQVKLLEFDCKAADPNTHQTQAFNQWFIDNQDTYKGAA